VRIFLSFLQSDENYSVPPYSHWEKYVKKGVQEAGYQWTEASEVDWAEGLTYGAGSPAIESWKDRTWTRTVEAVKDEHRREGVDLFLSYLYPKQVDRSAVQQIQALGIPCVNFFCDNVREFRSVPEPFHCFDLHWVPEYKALKMYEEAGLDYVHAPMPCWVPQEQRTCDHPGNYGPTFIGSRDPLREALFAEALDQGAPLELRGSGWEVDGDPGDGGGLSFSFSDIPEKIKNQIEFVNRWGISGLFNRLTYRFRPQIGDDVFQEAAHGWVSEEDFIRITQQSQVIVGVNRYPSFWAPFYRPDTYSRLRDIEAPMMGGCYLTEWTEGLSERYRLGKEIETYRSADELAQKIQELMQHPGKRKEMRCAAQERALRNHSIHQSIKKINEEVSK